ncbi:hypothetical protein BDQ17DRAFT_1332126 [Cyathus striatus]|nr:hypothetical protein BDQ17DRAFT_1332126 [Cyathus striatus]
MRFLSCLVQSNPAEQNSTNTRTNQPVGEKSPCKETPSNPYTSIFPPPFSSGGDVEEFIIRPDTTLAILINYSSSYPLSNAQRPWDRTVSKRRPCRLDTVNPGIINEKGWDTNRDVARVQRGDGDCGDASGERRPRVPKVRKTPQWAEVDGQLRYRGGTASWRKTPNDKISMLQTETADVTEDPEPASHNPVPDYVVNLQLLFISETADVEDPEPVSHIPVPDNVVNLQLSFIAVLWSFERKFYCGLETADVVEDPEPVSHNPAPDNVVNLQLLFIAIHWSFDGKFCC